METVIKCEKVKDWNGKPIYAIGLSDGQGGESFAQEIPIGTPMSELTITPNGNYAPKIKWNKATGGGGGFQAKQRAGNESFAMSYAKDILVGGKIELKHLFQTADKIYEWLESKKANPVPVASKPKTDPVQPQTTQSKSPLVNDDLPF
jgi:hypothetical protein